MGNKKNTVTAAKAQIGRDTKNSQAPTPQQTQGALADRHVRAHTPEVIEVGEDSDN